jgi:hypothetical protein
MRLKTREVPNFEVRCLLTDRINMIIQRSFFSKSLVTHVAFVVPLFVILLRNDMLESKYVRGVSLLPTWSLKYIDQTILDLRTSLTCFFRLDLSLKRWLQTSHSKSLIPSSGTCHKIERYIWQYNLLE